MTLRLRFAAAIAVLLLLTMPLVSYAATLQSLLTTFQSCITAAQAETDPTIKQEAYRACIADATAQINEILASRTTPPPAQGFCVNVTHNLVPGSTDTETNGDVTALQNYLIPTDFLVGPANGSYDDATKEAVGQLQISLHIVNSSSDPAYGFFGPRTRAAVACTGRASLVATPLSGIAPVNALFTASGNGTSYPGGVTLDFGDGASFQGCTPATACNTFNASHTYATPGTYVARLMGIGDGSSSVLGTATIVVRSSDPTGARATITASSLKTTSEHPTISGTAQNTSTVELMIEGNGIIHGTGAITVTNGGWSITVNDQTFPPGTYQVKVSDSTAQLLTTGTLYVNVTLSGASKDGSVLLPTSGGSLVTKDGRWTFGPEYDQYGHHILLNDVWASMGRATTLIVAQRGTLFAQGAYGSWFKWNGSGWPEIPKNSDGATISAGSSDILVNKDGLWYFGPAASEGGNVVILNGLRAGVGAATDLKIAQGGQMYAKRTGGVWYVWTGFTLGWRVYNGDPAGTTGVSVSVNSASLTSVSEIPTVTGTASGVKYLRVYFTAAGGTRYDAGIAEVNTSGAWSATAKTAVPAGTYTVKIYNQDNGSGGILSTLGPLVTSNVLTVYAATAYTITANPSTCTVDPTSGTCSMTISWTAPENVLTQLWVSTPGTADAQVSCQMRPQPLSKDVSWIQTVGHDFKLYTTPSCNPTDISGRTPVATLHVAGQQ